MKLIGQKRTNFKMKQENNEKLSADNVASGVQSMSLSGQPLSQAQQQAAQKSPLLHAWYDPLCNLKSTSTCMRLADLACDGQDFS